DPPGDERAVERTAAGGPGHPGGTVPQQAVRDHPRRPSAPPSRPTVLGLGGISRVATRRTADTALGHGSWRQLTSATGRGHWSVAL
ncbi:MAG: hypothetical protein AVDCRST_MAG69-1971, partial [uncultured Solirubrobacteraceae bacterium]